MVDIKTEKMNGRSNASPVRGFFGQAAEVTGDVIELAELQVRLAKVERCECCKDLDPSDCGYWYQWPRFTCITSRFAVCDRWFYRSIGRYLSGAGTIVG